MIMQWKKGKELRKNEKFNTQSFSARQNPSEFDAGNEEQEAS